MVSRVKQIAQWLFYRAEPTPRTTRRRQRSMAFALADGRRSDGVPAFLVR